MNKDKKIEIIRRRNDLLIKQLDDLKNKLNSERYAYKTTNNSLKERYDKETKQMQSLVYELEDINTEWKHIVQDLENKMNEYDDLIQSVKEIKKILFETGLKMKMPFSKKVKMFFHNYKTKTFK